MAKREKTIPDDAWINIPVTDLAPECQALVAKMQAADKAQQAAREAAIEGLTEAAREAGQLSADKAYKFSFYYLNREGTIGYVEIDRPKAKTAPVERKVATVNPFAKAPAVLLGPDKKPKANGGAGLKCEPKRAKA